MIAAELRVRRIPEERCIALWRFEQLLQAGYPRRAASRLAKREDVDLHLAADLVKHGCPVETALRIML
jgi:hypothetical protein